MIRRLMKSPLVRLSVVLWVALAIVVAVRNAYESGRFDGANRSNFEWLKVDADRVADLKEQRAAAWFWWSWSIAVGLIAVPGVWIMVRLWELVSR